MVYAEKMKAYQRGEDDRRGAEEERGGPPERSRSEHDRRGEERKEKMRRRAERKEKKMENLSSQLPPLSSAAIEQLLPSAAIVKLLILSLFLSFVSFPYKTRLQKQVVRSPESS